MHLRFSKICVAIFFLITSVLAGVRTQPSSALDIRHSNAHEESSIQLLDTRSALSSTGDELLPRLNSRNDDDEDDRDKDRDDEDEDEDDSVVDDIKDKANDIGDDIKDEANDIKDDVTDGVDDVFDDGAGSLRPGIIMPGLLAAAVVVAAGM